MAYIDLNPIRACMAATPEQSDHTSIKERIQPNFNLAEAVKEQTELAAHIQFNLPIMPLVHFEGATAQHKQNGILFSLADYLELVDYTGRAIRDGKRGAISSHLPNILQRLGIDQPTQTI